MRMSNLSSRSVSVGRLRLVELSNRLFAPVTFGAWLFRSCSSSVAVGIPGCNHGER
jgi:hypothetical protein